MKRYIILPAACSLVLHLFLLLGFTSSAHPIPAACTPLSDITDVVFRPQPAAPEGPAADSAAADSTASVRPDRPDAPEPPDSMVAPPEANWPQMQSIMPLTPIGPRWNGPVIAGPPGFGDGPETGYDATRLDQAPRAVVQPAPIYPSPERLTGTPGEVVVEFMVNREGVVHSVRILKSTSAAFEEPALRAVSKWRFEPGKKDGRPVAFRMMVPLVFHIAE